MLNDLEKQGQLFSAPYFEHSYPHCWRCDTPLIYYARESWFIKSVCGQREFNQKQQYNQLGSGKYRKRPLWRLVRKCSGLGISRNRYWGTPLNIWECKCGHQQAMVVLMN
ncbi:class I tRNA ligase family protein [Hungatella sp.]|uniref:class I tRNA ligase family protein n=1 Tax=Hungatella sp. TaxID=2613924 RepID=UPI0039960DB0